MKDLQSYRRMLHCKIHRARVTHADINYEGSITIPPELLEAAEIAEYEAVWVWSVSNGSRFETYAIRGKPGSRDLAVNGAAARLVSPGDVVIIAAFALVPAGELAAYIPRLVFVDENNRLLPSRAEIPGPANVLMT